MPEVVLVSLMLTLNILDMMLLLFFLLTLNLYILDGILYYLNNLILSLHFRGVSKSPVIFKMKLYVTTLKNSFQSWPIFCCKEIHFRCCLGVELNIWKGNKKSERYMGQPIWLNTNLGKYEKLTLLDAPKIDFQKFFKLNFFALNIKWTGLFFVAKRSILDVA